MSASSARIVYIAPHSPLPRNFGAAQRVDALWRTLRRVGEVRLIVLGDRPAPGARRELLRQDAIVFPPRIETPRRRLARLMSAFATGRCIPAARYLSPRRIQRIVGQVRSFRPDVVVVGGEYLSVLIPDLTAVGARIVLDTHNAASRGHERIAASSRNPFTKLSYGLLARNTAGVERRFFPLADEVWAVSPDDAAFYAPLSRRPVRVVPNVVELPAIVKDVTEPGSVVFVGAFAYWPNEDAALRLIEMAPRLRAAGALERLYLVGLGPTAAMRRAAERRREIVITGPVPDVGPFLRRASVVAIPLSAGSGTKLKVLEAMAHGKPVVTTPVGAEGLDITAGVQADVVTLGEFEGALGKLAADEQRRASLAKAARGWVEARFSPAALERQVRAALVPGTAGPRSATSG